MKRDWGKDTPPDTHSTLLRGRIETDLSTQSILFKLKLLYLNVINVCRVNPAIYFVCIAI